MGGMVLPRPGEVGPLRATASPAAKEIYFGAQGNSAKDAAILARDVSKAVSNRAAEASPWQKEAAARRGPQPAEPTAAGVPPPSPITSELASALKRRQQAAEAAAAAEGAAQAQAARGDAATDLSGVGSELAAKLARRQSALGAAPAAGEPASPS